MSLSPDTWFEHIQAWMQTQQTQVDYCRHHGLTPHQFTYWKQKYHATQQTNQGETRSGFVVAQFETRISTQSGPTMCLPDGTQITDVSATNILIVAQLLRELR